VSSPAKGSQLQVRIYVNRRPADLTGAVLQALPSLRERTTRLCWTAPLEHDGFREPQDRDFLRAVGHEDLVDRLKEFWPVGGPVWDALALAVFPAGRPGIVLAEGKGYPEEHRGGGCQATEPARTKILAAVTRAQQWLGATVEPARWLGPLYQSANRYAHLYWLREVVGVEAWLVHLLFIDDRTHRPVARADWQTVLPAIHAELGVPATGPAWADVYLPALAAEELTRAATLA
jgi:hypothetical protein